MSDRTETSETKIYRPGRKKDVLCRLTYEVTFLRKGMCRWFLLGIEELE